jgi:FMNH2-dependent dimethyl sulfone monooxygenase
MAAQDLEASRRALNPLFNDNRIKLGVFALNVSSGCAITTAEGRLELTWPRVRNIARLGAPSTPSRFNSLSRPS